MRKMQMSVSSMNKGASKRALLDRHAFSLSHEVGRDRQAGSKEVGPICWTRCEHDTSPLTANEHFANRFGKPEFERHGDRLRSVVPAHTGVGLGDGVGLVFTAMYQSLWQIKSIKLWRPASDQSPYSSCSGCVKNSFPLHSYSFKKHI